MFPGGSGAQTHTEFGPSVLVIFFKIVSTFGPFWSARSGPPPHTATHQLSLYHFFKIVSTLGPFCTGRVPDSAGSIYQPCKPPSAVQCSSVQSSSVQFSSVQFHTYLSGLLAGIIFVPTITPLAYRFGRPYFLDQPLVDWNSSKC